MTLDDQLLALEEGFWTAVDRAGYYSEHLAGDAVMVFPAPYGIFDEEAIMGSIDSTPPWKAVRIDHANVVRLRDSAAVLAYRAEAQDGTGGSYSAYAASAYVKQDDGAWRLAFHQQTPIE